MADTAILRTVWPEGGDPLTRAVWRLRSRGCWEEAAGLLAPLVPHHHGAALRQVELHVERCLFTSEGWDRAEEALRAAESLPLTDAERGIAACERGHLAYASTHLDVRDRTDEARSALGRAAALLEPSGPDRPLLDYRRGLMAQHLTDSPQDAEASYRRALAEATARGDKLLCASVTRQLGSLAVLGGDPGQAREHFAESLRLCEEIGYLVGAAPALAALAEVEPEAEAHRLRAEAARLVRLLGGVPRWLAPRPLPGQGRATAGADAPEAAAGSR
ncbi:MULTISPECIES: tetratricopeptide repeat protein [unclassified Streptomyces]|uniref:tetratricopeptide repeat protein n=1 Tax=unclassified Streptomyces TaxID=2593676 RepID=UPI000CD51682|nr:MULTISPECIES: tetratricopeptide repeat protein [unclassified Streptomyces]